MTLSLVAIVFSVFVSCWLGFYLASHSWSTFPLRRAAGGLLAFAVGMGLEGVGEVVGTLPSSALFRAVQTSLFFVATVGWGVGLYPLAKRTSLQERPRWRLFGIALICLGLEAGALLLPILPFPRLWLYLALGIDLGLLAILLVQWVAADQGESITYHALRSFDGALLGALLFGSQVVLAAALGAGFNLPMYLLLLGVTVTAILVATLGTAVQNALDTLAFGQFPHLRVVRTELRVAQDTLPRVAATAALGEIRDEEFARHTRHALRSLGNLTQLAANPLVDLRAVTCALESAGQPLTLTSRAMALQTLLTETVITLKPEASDFGTTPAWRHYNALYYPYVVGMKPYSVKSTVEDIEPQHREAWQWFREQVPERTLYHWQRTAVNVVARALKEQEHA